MTDLSPEEIRESKTQLNREAFCLRLKTTVLGTGQKLEGYFVGVDEHSPGYSSLVCSRDLGNAKFYPSRSEAEEAKNMLFTIHSTALEHSAEIDRIDIVSIKDE